MNKYERLVFPDKVNDKAWNKISFLFECEGRKCSKEEFENLNSLDANPNGTIVCFADDDFPLMLNNGSELSLAKDFASSGMIRSIRGQNFILPYKKGWANRESPYYPDFLLHLKDGRIAFIELKSILGMCQDETICKYNHLKEYCFQHGYICAMIDVDFLCFEEYLWPMTEDEVSSYFKQVIDAQQCFNNNHLDELLQRFPKNKAANIKREIASLVLQDPMITNRYCHDDPRLINAVKTNQILPYKKKILKHF